MTYPEVLDYLYSQLPMYQRIGSVAFKKDLSRTIQLCEAMDNPQHKFKSIHIAGTNGKGSTAHMIAGMLQAAGLKVGLYSSPHYRDYRERIKINGKYIPHKAVIDFVAKNKDIIEAIGPSFFEMTVVLGFDHFAAQHVDIAVIETGLGGRLDSTNVIEPLVSVITNIGLDHQAILGDTIPLIASEKAGIIKEGIPCVMGRRQVDTQSIFAEVAASNAAPLIYADDIIATEVKSMQMDRVEIAYVLDGLETLNVSLASGVAYNIENCRTAIAVIKTLNNGGVFNISDNEITSGLSDFTSSTKYIGRWHIKSRDPLVLLDAAHNVDGITGLFKEIDKYSFDRIHIILGMVSDKEADKILSLLPSTAKYYFCKPEIPRGKDSNELREDASRFELKGRSYVSCKNALIAAKRSAGKGDLILATGSSFVVAELV